MATVLITGGHAGIGLACSRQLAGQPELRLVLAGRSIERMEPVARELRAAHGIDVDVLPLDTSSLASVRAAAAQLRAMLADDATGPLQAILCNAGGQFRGPLSRSVDGYEQTFATNYLGHFLLVQLLLDQVASDGRIVLTSSGTHDPETADGRLVGKAAAPDAAALANTGRNGKPLPAGIRYTTSKLCMMLFAYELDRRLRRSESPIASVAFDPGSIPETGLLRTLPKPAQWLIRTQAMKAITRRMGVTQGSVGFSGAALARLATDPAFADASGKYFQSNDGAALLAGVAERDFRAFTAAFDAIDRSTRAPLEKVEAALAAVVTYGETHPARYRLLFSDPDLGRRGGQLERVATETFAAFARLVEAAQRAGELPAVPAPTLTGLIYATVHGLLDLEAGGRLREEKGFSDVLGGASLLLRLLAAK